VLEVNFAGERCNSRCPFDFAWGRLSAGLRDDKKKAAGSEKKGRGEGGEVNGTAKALGDIL
jgi:hypothetical protein